MSTFSNSRSDSFDSIPDVGFICKSLENEEDPIARMAQESLVSEFKLKELNGELAPEPLLMADSKRFVLFPIKHPDVSNNLTTFGFIHDFKFFLS